jgi:Methyltransferase domain
MNDLHGYFLNNADKPIFKWLHYFDIYERHFARFRGQQIRFLEIGVARGGSLEMWRDYFGPDATIVGIDIRDRWPVDPETARVFIGSQNDRDFLRSVADEIGTFDIILDDGSHVAGDVITSFETLYPLMSPQGVYAIEDVHCAYDSKFDGGLGRPGTIIEYAKSLLDRLHFAWLNEEEPDPFGMTTHSIAAYDSMLIFERRPKPQLQTFYTGGYGSLSPKPMIGPQPNPKKS